MNTLDRTHLLPAFAAFALGAAGVLAAPAAEARITRIMITSTQTPTFDGKTFGAVGAYEKLRGKAFGEVDPADPRNAVITDLELAPKVGGKVQYEMDIYILRPVDLGNGNRKLFMEVNNRGNKLFGGFNLSSGGNDPTTAAHAGDAFLMNQGYSLAWNGWDISAAPGNNRLTITVPIAKNPGNTTITGPSYEYIVFDNANTMSSALSYPAADLDKSNATLTVRALLDDGPLTVPATQWEYTDATGMAIRLLPLGTPFAQSAIYEFTYTARDPLVAGLGLAATRDFVSFLRHAAMDDFGNPNPLAGHVDHTYTWTLSQPGRYLNDFQTLGFNEDEDGRRVIDGMLNWIGGSSGVAINYRFAQTARTQRNRQNHLYPEGIFPFAYQVLHDPLTGKTAGRSQRCTATNTCPNAIEVNSANEYWVKAASLLHTDLDGKDLKDPDNARFFLISGAQHGTGNAANMGSCQQFQNPTNAEPALRALLVALDEWVSQGVQPPKSQVPRRSHGAFAVPVPGSQTGVVPQKKLGWPDIPGVTYNGLITTRYLLDFGPMFDDGIISNYPPSVDGRPTYPHFVSKVDEDGNEIEGIQLPGVAAPVATTTGWALRRAGFGENDGCEAAGQNIPFRTTKAERQAAGDPRKSLEERYKDHAGYVKAVTKAAGKLQKDRLLLPYDVQKYIDAAQASSVLQ